MDTRTALLLEVALPSVSVQAVSRSARVDIPIAIVYREVAPGPVSHRGQARELGLGLGDAKSGRHVPRAYQRIANPWSDLL